MENNNIVLDAYVIIKWFTKEENRDKAINIRDKYINEEIEIFVPDLILYEITNALRYNPNFDENDVKEALNSLFDLGITIITPTKEILEKAIDIAFSNNTSLYDSTYIALSEIIGFEFITADEKLYNKVKDEFERVRLL